MPADSKGVSTPNCASETNARTSSAMMSCTCCSLIPATFLRAPRLPPSSQMSFAKSDNAGAETRATTSGLLGTAVRIEMALVASAALRSSA
eukprot:scaffold65394_cov27-Tisochrysis_lutea.AAC.3